MRVAKQIDKLVEAIIDGADALAVNAKLKALERQKADLEDKLAEAPDAEPLLHPALATIYRDKGQRLEVSLRQRDNGREAFELPDPKYVTSSLCRACRSASGLCARTTVCWFHSRAEQISSCRDASWFSRQWFSSASLLKPSPAFAIVRRRTETMAKRV